MTEDAVVARIPIRYTDVLGSNVQLHQFPLLNKQLQVPPSAELAGKKISARRKPDCGRMLIQLPLDVRPDVWNQEKGYELGKARAEGDQQTAADIGAEPSIAAGEIPVTNVNGHQQQRLNFARLKSEQVAHRGSYTLGALKDGVLYLHPISETHLFKPSLEYLDVISRRKNTRKRATGSDSDDSDDGPPPDPDEQPAPPKEPKDKKKRSGEIKEVTVSAKKTEEKGGVQFQGGLSNARREMLLAIRKEEEEPWQSYDYNVGDVGATFITCQPYPISLVDPVN
jgi:DNA-directed RNA polymerase-3 subunit RPC5